MKTYITIVIGMVTANMIFFCNTSHLPNVIYGRTTIDMNVPKIKPPNISQLSSRGREPTNKIK